MREGQRAAGVVGHRGTVQNKIQREHAVARRTLFTTEDTKKDNSTRLCTDSASKIPLTHSSDGRAGIQAKKIPDKLWIKKFAEKPSH